MNARTDIPLGCIDDMPAERWKPAPGFDGLYAVSDHGRVMSEGRIVRYRGDAMRGVPSRLLRPTIANGYQVARLWCDGVETRKFVHRLVLETFTGPAPSPDLQCAHRDGNPLNNHVANLRWATGKENQADRVDHGTANRGERHGMAKLTLAEVQRIHTDARTNAAIARELSVCPSTVSRIRLRKDWSWL